MKLLLKEAKSMDIMTRCHQLYCINKSVKGPNMQKCLNSRINMTRHTIFSFFSYFGHLSVL